MTVFVIMRMAMVQETNGNLYLMHCHALLQPLATMILVAQEKSKLLQATVRAIVTSTKNTLNHWKYHEEHNSWIMVNAYLK